MKTRNLFRGLRLSTTLDRMSIKSAKTMLLAAVLVTANWSPVTAQVKIGGDPETAPATGVVLDLSDATTGGLQLPQVTLTATTGEGAIPASWGTDAVPAGVMVYNTGDDAAVPAGVYVWDAADGWKVASGGGGGGNTPAVVPVESVTIAPSVLQSIPQGATQTFTVSITPTNATYSSIEWNGSGDVVSMATNFALRRAAFTGLKPGSTEVSATVGGKTSEAITLDVTAPVPGLIDIKPNVVNTPGYIVLTVSAVEGAETYMWTYPNLFTANNTTQTTVSNTLLLTTVANMPGTIEVGDISVVAKGGSGETLMDAASTQTVVIIQKATSITGLPATKEITSEAPVAAMPYTVQPSNTNDKSVVWTSSNDSIATVSASGNIFPHKNGTVIIKVAIADDPSIYMECVVTISGIFKLCDVVIGDICMSTPSQYLTNKASSAGFCSDRGFSLPTTSQLPTIVAGLNAAGYMAPNNTRFVSSLPVQANGGYTDICGGSTSWNIETMLCTNGVWTVNMLNAGYTTTLCGKGEYKDPTVFNVVCVSDHFN